MKRLFKQLVCRSWRTSIRYDSVIYVVVFVGAAPGVDQEGEVIQDVADAWLRVRAATWFVASDLSVAQVRDHLGDLGFRAAVVRVAPTWATTGGVANVTSWLRSADGHF